MTRVWRLERAVGPAADFHARALPSGTERTVAVLTVERPGPRARQHPARRRRRPRRGRRPPASTWCGGAAGEGRCWSSPERTVWIDVDLPAGDPLWTDDVGRSFGWLGRTWAAALGGLGLARRGARGRAVHDTVVAAHLLRRAGPGEVTVRRGEGGRPGPAPDPPRRPLPDRGQPGVGSRRRSPGCSRSMPEERARAVADLRDAVVPGAGTGGPGRRRLPRRASVTAFRNKTVLGARGRAERGRARQERLGFLAPNTRSVMLRPRSVRKALRRP